MSRKEVKVRLATLSDVEQLSDLVGDYHASASFDLIIEDRKLVIKDLLENANYGFVIIASVDEKLIAYLTVCYSYSIRLGGRDAFMDEFFVCENFRGMKIGHQLLERAKQFARSHQVKALHFEVAKTNEAAKAFCQGQGFSSQDDFHLMTYDL